MKLCFAAVSENEAFARACVSSFLSQLDPLVSELAELKTAVSEAVTNSIVHGYRNISGGTVLLQMRLYADRRVYIKIRDKGCGIEDISKAMQPLFTTAPEEERAGLGFSVMESFTDSLRVKSSSGHGTVLVMEKILQEKDDGSIESEFSDKSRRKHRTCTPLRK
ncbi:MAG: anti-sigma F factor [Ruminococcus sp.]|nr:anti-sigma F factor [Ruminococcus sp.]